MTPDRDEFSILVTSTASDELYSDNTALSYSARLPHEIQLESDWECSLVNTAFHKNWFNIQDGENTFYVSFNYNIAGESSRDVVWLKSIIPLGYYDSVETLLKTLNDIEFKWSVPGRDSEGDNEGETYWVIGVLSTISGKTGGEAKEEVKSGKVVCTQGANDPRITVTLTGDLAAIKFGEGLAQTLGFDSNKVIVNNDNGEGTTAGDTPCLDWKRLFVTLTCNIVGHQIFNNKTLPALRTFSISDIGQWGLVTGEFDPSYVRVDVKQFDTIHIEILDILGKSIKAVGRGVGLTELHFRKM